MIENFFHRSMIANSSLIQLKYKILDYGRENGRGSTRAIRDKRTPRTAEVESILRGRLPKGLK